MENNRTYHIIGAGIAGLFAAKILKEKHPLSSVIVYEAAEKIGGRCSSFFDRDFNCSVDYATHVVLNRNRRAAKLLGKKSFTHRLCFWDFLQKRFIPSFTCPREIISAVFNTSAPSLRSVAFVLRKLFPFWGLKAYFSNGELADDLCAPLLCYVDDIQYGCLWQGIEHQDNHITKLLFNKQTVFIAPQDIIVSAVDSYNYHKIIGGEDFEYSPICNIFFSSSNIPPLPKSQKILGLKNSISQWLFQTPTYTAVTVSDAQATPDAAKIWQEICHISDAGKMPLPLYKVRNFPRATLKQDKFNNNKRPTSCLTAFDNLYICGDWTIKNQPCCIETALNSAARLAKFI